MDKTIIKNAVSSNGQEVKVYRYDDTFYVDVFEGDHLIQRTPYEQLDEALSYYYTLVSSACAYGNRLWRVK